MKPIRKLTLPVVTVLAAPYIAGSFIDSAFDVHDAPDAPPVVTVVSSGEAGFAYDTLADQPVDARPHRVLIMSGKTVRLD